MYFYILFIRPIFKIFQYNEIYLGVEYLNIFKSAKATRPRPRFEHRLFLHTIRLRSLMYRQARLQRY